MGPQQRLLPVDGAISLGGETMGSQFTVTSNGVDGFTNKEPPLPSVNKCTPIEIKVTSMITYLFTLQYKRSKGICKGKKPGYQGNAHLSTEA